VGRLWPLAAGQEGAEPVALQGQRRAATAIAFSSDGRWVASLAADHELRAWDLGGGADRAGGGRAIATRCEGPVAFSADSRSLAAVSDEGLVTVYPLAAGGASGRRAASGSGVRALAFS